MGSTVSRMLPFRRNDGDVQAVDIANSNAYKWPPISGRYFGTYFIMGGERFDSQPPETFLFGENNDLNFMGNRPVPFPYPVPQLSEPTRTLRSLVNIRKDTIRLVRADIPYGEAVDQAKQGDGDKAEQPVPQKLPEEAEAASTDEVPPASPDETDAVLGATAPAPIHKYNIEFTFDSDVASNITIYYFAVESMQNGVVSYRPRIAEMTSEPVRYKQGANQMFSHTTHIIQPADFTEEEWQFDFEKEEIPIVIHCAVDNPEHPGHSHVTLCSLEKQNDGYSVKPVKQKQCVDGLLYILQEFYGIENKETDKKEEEDEFGDNTAECVICMSELRDTLILPCRHLCLCNKCADSLRYQATNCPICRAPFRALLQLRAIRAKGSSPDHRETNTSDDDDMAEVSQKGVPTGYEAISLIEALNGPSFLSRSSAEPKPKGGSQASIRRSKKKKKDGSKVGSKITLKDKLEKDDNAAAENRDNTVVETMGNAEETATSEVKPSQADRGEAKNEKDSSETETHTPPIEPQADLNSDPNADQKHSSEIPRSPEAGRQHSNSSAGSAEDEALAVSPRSETTTLPGTPDHVLEDDRIDV